MKKSRAILILVLLALTMAFMQSCAKRDCNGKKSHKLNNGMYM